MVHFTARGFTAQGRQRGLVALIVLLVLLLGSIVALYGVSGASVNIDAKREAFNRDVLIRAKTALIEYTVSRDDPDRPGAFPCPVPAPSSVNYRGEGQAAIACGAANLIGRLPWKTLGLPELRDADGELLWYAVSAAFSYQQIPNSNFSSAVNSNTQSKLVIETDQVGAPTINNVAVVIFAAGSPLAAQDRSNTIKTCATTSKKIEAVYCPDNYLEPKGSANNADADGPFARAKKSPTLNDQLEYIVPEDFIPSIEGRIAAHVKQSLAVYFASNGYYPYAAPFDDYDDAFCGLNVYSGRFADSATNGGTSSAAYCGKRLDKNGKEIGAEDWPPSGTPGALPAWFLNNYWHSTMFYAVAKSYTNGAPRTSPPCIVPGDCLTLDGDPTTQVVVIFPGTPNSTQSRPTSASAKSAKIGKDISNYFESAENLDAWATADNFVYVSTTSSIPSRDLVLGIKN